MSIMVGDTKPVYPADVQAALDHMDDEGWTTERCHAVLAIALAHLEEEPLPEVVVQVADEPIRWLEEIWSGNFAETVIEAGAIYLVCPVCCTSGTFEFFQEGAEFAGISVEETDSEWESEVAVVYRRSSYDFNADGVFGLSHQANGCYARLGIPAWMTADD